MVANRDQAACRVKLRFLGGFDVGGPGGPIHLESAKTMALLAYLAIQGTPQTRQKLMGFLWANLPEKNAARNLRHALWNLRRSLAPSGAACIRATRQTVAFVPVSGIWLDTAEFRRACENLEGRSPHAAIEMETLGAAVELYRGDLLDGFYADGAPAFEEWLLIERERFRSMAVAAFQRLVVHHRQRGDYGASLFFARRLLALDPWREEAHRVVMDLLARAGHRSAAMAQYQACRQVLAEELHSEPTPETTALFERIRDEAARAAPALAPREKGSKKPPTIPAHNIAPPPTPFVGREDELACIAGLLSNPDCRLLTLVGPGGIGKTRLAVQAALQALVPGASGESLFPDGVFFVSLAELVSPAQLVPAISSALRFSLQGAVDPKTQLLSFLREKRMLLILDNFEHLLSATALLSEILQAAPEAKLLVTSRARLAMKAEWALEVGGLAVPGNGEEGDPNRDSALRLFLQCARRADLGFVLRREEIPELARICRLLDGMPLGIELAAGWVRTLSLSEIRSEIDANLDFLATSLEGVPPRQRSLRAIFDSSWRTLGEEEKAVFAALSVFRGGFTREAARDVAGASLLALSALVDRFLLRRDPSGRYHIHPVLGQYASEKLGETPSDKERVTARHGAHFAAFLHDREALLWGPAQTRALQEIGEELENARAAWSWALASRRVDAVGSMLEGLSLFYDMRGWFKEAENSIGEAIGRLSGIESEAEGRAVLFGRLQTARGHFLNQMGLYGQAAKVLEEARDLLRDQASPRALAEALFHLGETHVGLSQYAEARRLFEESLALARGCGDRKITAKALGRFGRVAIEQGSLEEADTRLEEALALAKEAGDVAEKIYALTQLGHSAYFQRRHERAKVFLSEALDLARGSGNRSGITLALDGLGYVAEDLGDYGEAKACYEEGLAVGLETGDRLSVTRQLTLLGEVARRQQAWAEAKEFYRRAIAAGRETGNQYFLSANLGNLAFVAVELGELEEALRLAREAARLGLAMRSLVLVLPALVSAAAVAAKQGDADRALGLLGLVANHPAYRADTRLDLDRVLASLRAVLPARTVESGLEAGRHQSLDTVIEDFLRE